MNSAMLALEDGSVFEGWSFGAPTERSGEVVFNTALTGYQEVFTDPSNFGQITNPQIGNYRASRGGNEASRPYIGGLAVREFSHIASDWRSDKEANSFLGQNGIPVISGVTTREPHEWTASVEPCSPSDLIGRTREATHHVVAYDYGIKRNILRRLVALSPDGIFRSNGPGDPEPLEPQIANIRKVVGKKPIFRICLGHRPQLHRSCH